MRAKEFITESNLLTDVPNDNWLKDKVDYAKRKGRDQYGVPYMGSITGYFRDNVNVPVSILKTLPGMRGEQKRVRHDDLEAIMKIMKSTGKLPLNDNGKESAPFVMVAYNGEAWVNEGNHRIMAAAKLGFDELPVEIRYFDGGERVESGPLYPPKIGVQAPIDEMALSTYKTMGDFSKPGPFIGPDKKLVPHPKNIEKATTFFEKTPYDFRLFFSNIPGTGKYSEYGPMSPDEIRKVFGPQAESILQDSGDSITVVFVGNKGDRKVMLTPWMMAHRFGHAVQAGSRKNRGWSPWVEVANHFFNTVNSIMDDYYGKISTHGNDYYRGNIDPFKWGLTPEYNALFNAIGTQRSSRSNEIRRPYEFLYELFAQYLGTGKITFNPLPTNLGYGRKAWGNPTKYMNLKREYNDEDTRKEATEILARDMELMFDDVLSNSVGKIFVM